MTQATRIRICPQIEDGQTAVVWLKDEERTVMASWYGLANGRVRLVPLNPTYKPITKNVRDVVVQGRVLCVLRYWP